jgi:polar amino acid transport system substrate-binding protein
MALTTRRLAVLVFVLALGALTVAGCGSSDKKKTTSTAASTAASASAASSTTAATAMDSAAAALVPSAIKSKGSITVAADASYAPNEFVATDGKTVVGMDADLATALATTLGLKAKVVNQTFDSIIPGIQAGRYGMGASSFTDTKEREKVVDFVTYFSAGTSFYVKADGGPAVAKLADLCDHTVAVEKGTTQQDDATAQSKKCKVTVQVYPDQSAANQALHSGRAEVSMADSPVAAYAVKQSSGAFKLSGTPYGTAPYGLALPKGNKMAPAVLAALKVLMSNGQYKAILAKWGVQSGAITDPAINGATS